MHEASHQLLLRPNISAASNHSHRSAAILYSFCCYCMMQPSTCCNPQVQAAGILAGEQQVTTSQAPFSFALVSDFRSFASAVLHSGTKYVISFKCAVSFISCKDCLVVNKVASLLMLGSKHRRSSWHHALYNNLQSHEQPLLIKPKTFFNRTLQDQTIMHKQKTKFKVNHEFASYFDTFWGCVAPQTTQSTKINGRVFFLWCHRLQVTAMSCFYGILTVCTCKGVYPACPVWSITHLVQQLTRINHSNTPPLLSVNVSCYHCNGNTTASPLSYSVEIHPHPR
jgi:hypothetical protein